MDVHAWDTDMGVHCINDNHVLTLIYAALIDLPLTSTGVGPSVVVRPR